jgi:two-component sensor histidine kinase
VKIFNPIKKLDSKGLLLYRFHLTLIAVNLIAIVIDTLFQRYYNAAIETTAVFLLFGSLAYLYKNNNIKKSAYIFLAITATTLFSLIAINHFATMSVIFVLLLPLTTLLFIRMKHSLWIEALLFIVMAILLYIEYLYNPSNPLVQNPQALFNLAYTAIIIYIFGLLYHFSIQTTFDELDQANRQKELLLSEVHHRVKNNLNVIASIIGLQANRLKDDERDHLLASKTRIESIAMVHEMLYKCNDFENISFKSYMQQLTDLLLRMYATYKSINIAINSDTENMPLDVMIQLGMIVNELVTNSIKYAFKQNSGNVIIELKRDDDGYCFYYRDDGSGVEDTQTLLQSKSLGIKIIHLAAKQLQGTITISNQNGLSYEIEFKHE